ncbi:MAG: ABC transporter substrate-binding protein [Alphaproteobacteria bacterium]|nr:MAG: ABC transporter substrate-binding protein [Alphaproteobacteria bacterium]
MGIRVAVVAYLFLISVSGVNGEQKDRLYGKNPYLTLMASPQIPASATHLPAANPHASMGRDTHLRTIVIGNAFDCLFPFANKGIPACGNGITDEPLVFERLMYRNPDEPFTFYPWLASYVEVAPDNSWVRFSLNPQATWADGKPVSAEDVAFTCEVLRTQGRIIFRNLYASVARIVVENPHTVRFVMKACDHPTEKGKTYYSRENIMVLAGMTVLPKHVIGPRHLDEIVQEKLPGSGPYAYGMVVNGRRISYVRRSDYWGDRARLMIAKGRYNFQKLTFTYFREANVGFEGLKAGEGDFFIEENIRRRLRGYTFDRFTRGDVTLTCASNVQPKSMLGFVMNTRQFPFDNYHFRKAMVLACDWGWIAHNLYGGAYVRANSYFMHTDFSACAGDTLVAGSSVAQVKKAPPLHIKNPRRRHQRVIRLLKRAGWIIKNGICVSEKTGVPLEMSLLLEGDEHKPEAIAYARNLKAFGITLTIHRKDSAQYWRKVLAFDYQMTAFRWTGSQSPGAEQRNRWTTESADIKGSLNFAQVRDGQVDQAVRLLLGSQTYEEQRSAAQMLDHRLLSLYLVVPLGHPAQTCALHASNLTFLTKSDRLKIPEKSFWWDQTASH